jgi:rfaE bifunctional protein nucleotidyltransferase chain/domain/rfaE bifunctional protein kinase chain/domain
MTAGATIVVIGDAVLDLDVLGSADRLAPDAPVPVLDVTGERARPGGAGLAAALLAAAGEPTVLVTALSPDPDGERLRALLEPAVTLLTGPAEGGTAVKTRMWADGRSLLRADRGAGRPGTGFGAAVAGPLDAALAGAAAVLVSDYGRGVAADPQVRAALQRALARGVPVVWDPHPRGAAPVPDTTVVTPNLAEAVAAAGAAARAPAGAVPAGLAAAGRLLERWPCRAAAVTIGEHGAVVAHRHGARAALPAPAVEGGDRCGAGDAFAGRLAALLGTGATVDDAVHGAVLTAAAFVARGGAAAYDGAAADRAAADGAGEPSTAGHGAAGAAPDAAPVREAARPEPADLVAARALVDRVRAAGGTVVASGGCFDLLHTGHSRTLAAARALGDCLVVLLNSDASVRRLKGPDRPIVAAPERAELLLALGCVDAVVIFEEDDPCAVLDRLRPDLWVKGGDYDPAALPETALVRSWGGEVAAVPYRPDRSTTRLLEVAARSAGSARSAAASRARDRGLPRRLEQR